MHKYCVLLSYLLGQTSYILKVNTSSCLKVNNFSDAMNATNYYVSTTRLVLQADPDSPPSWQDLYTALPTLRFEYRMKGYSRSRNKQADDSGISVTVNLLRI